MKFVIGIGNPEKRYDKTRHNIGFQVLDALNLKGNDSIFWKANKRFNANVAGFDDHFLVKPLTFVNLTGESARAIADEHHLKSGELLFVCDDVNLEFGKIRLRASGSAGGHHGLESVIEALGTQDFPRLRIGVKNEKMPKDLTGFVLEKFSTGEKKELGKILEKAASVCETWMREGFDAALNNLSRLQSIRGEKE